MRAFLAALFVASAVPIHADTIGPYTDLIVFGDSLSDSGNTAIIADTYGSGFPYAGYPNGQFTNGDTWATQLGLLPSLLGGTNYAYGAARTLENGDAYPDLDAQIAQFIGDAPTLGDNPLAAIWTGGNDFRDFLSAGGGDAAATAAFIGGLITEIGDAVATIAGAGVGDIILMGLPDLGKLPGFVGTIYESAISQSVNGFNLALSNLSSQLDALMSGINVSFFDTNSYFVELLGPDNPYGFTNWTGMCLYLGATCNPDEYVFWDEIHPTELVHEILAGALVNELTPVPLPAGFPLLIGGIAVLGLLSRRRRSLA